METFETKARRRVGERLRAHRPARRTPLSGFYQAAFLDRDHWFMANGKRPFVWEKASHDKDALGVTGLGLIVGGFYVAIWFGLHPKSLAAFHLGSGGLTLGFLGIVLSLTCISGVNEGVALAIHDLLFRRRCLDASAHDLLGEWLQNEREWARTASGWMDEAGRLTGREAVLLRWARGQVRAARKRDASSSSLTKPRGARMAWVREGLRRLRRRTTGRLHARWRAERNAVMAYRQAEKDEDRRREEEAAASFARGPIAAARLARELEAEMPAQDALPNGSHPRARL